MLGDLGSWSWLCLQRGSLSSLSGTGFSPLWSGKVPPVCPASLTRPHGPEMAWHPWDGQVLD